MEHFVFNFHEQCEGVLVTAVESGIHRSFMSSGMWGKALLDESELWVPGMETEGKERGVEHSVSH